MGIIDCFAPIDSKNNSYKNNKSLFSLGCTASLWIHPFGCIPLDARSKPKVIPTKYGYNPYDEYFKKELQ
jgi:hypothetical protein